MQADEAGESSPTLLRRVSRWAFGSRVLSRRGGARAARWRRNSLTAVRLS